MAESTSNVKPDNANRMPLKRTLDSSPEDFQVREDAGEPVIKQLREENEKKDEEIRRLRAQLEDEKQRNKRGILPKIVDTLTRSTPRNRTTDKWGVQRFGCKECVRCPRFEWDGKSEGHPDEVDFCFCRCQSTVHLPNPSAVIHKVEPLQGAPQLPDPQILSHSSILMFGKRYEYGDYGIKVSPCDGTGHCKDVTVIGITSWTKDKVDQLIEKWKKNEFRALKYDVLENNCHNFANNLCKALVNKGIPSKVMELQRKLRGSSLGRGIAGSFQSSR